MYISNCVYNPIFTSARTTILRPGKDTAWDDFQAYGPFELIVDSSNEGVGVQLSKAEGNMIVHRLLRVGTNQIGTFGPGIYQLALACENPPYTNCFAEARVIGNVAPYTYPYSDLG